MIGAAVAAPWSSRFHGPGMEEGPAAVAAALGIDAEVVEFQLEQPPTEALAAGLPRLHDAVAAAPGIPLALLGECTLAPAVTAGLLAAHPDLVLVWLDAHGDLNTPDTSPSGFLGGMPFAILLGWCHEPLRRAAGAELPLPEQRAALVGARDLDPGERDAIAGSLLVVADDVAGALAGLPGRGAGARAPRRRRARPGRRPRRRLPGPGRLERGPARRRDGRAGGDRPGRRRERLLRQSAPRSGRPLGPGVCARPAAAPGLTVP